VKRLAYIMAFGKVPVGYVRVRKGTTGLSPDCLIEEKFVSVSETTEQAT